LLQTVLQTIQHVFGSLGTLFRGVTDPRQAGKIRYPLPVLLFTGTWMFCCHLAARRQIHWRLRTAAGAVNMQALGGVATVPHGDTVERTFRRLNPEELQEVQCRAVERLIRQKMLAAYRLFDRSYRIAVDGSQVSTFEERHCAHCLTRTQDGKTTFYHHVLEAKVVAPNGFAISIMSEFIANPGEHPTKQDCELKAFDRLAKRLKARFPRLPICLTLDGLYACGRVFDLCRKFRWRYLIVLKEGDIPFLDQEFHSLSAMEPKSHLAPRDRITHQAGQDGTIRQDLTWVNEINYRDSHKRTHTVSVLECIETTSRRKTYRWVTDFRITKKNAPLVANGAGRIRWKIENEGFNTQKNGGFDLEHAYSKNENAEKIYYFLMQLAHLIEQLVAKGSLLKQRFPKGFGSVKNLAASLLEAWRHVRLAADTWAQLAKIRIQLRFDSS